jgi:hypothetical protein
MSGYNKLYIVVLCSGKVWTSKNHNKFNMKNKIIENFAILLISIFLR